jgi:hypothetical protein
MCQAVVEMLYPVIDGFCSVFQVVGLVYGAILLVQLVLCVALLLIGLQMLGEALVSRVRGAFARPSTTPGSA